MKKIFRVFIIAAIGILALGTYSVQAATIRISTPKIELELAPGETYSGEIVAENPTDEDVKVKLYLEDWVYKAAGTGEKTFTPAATTPLSASKWINFSPAEDVIKPFGRLTARYTITVPKEAQGAHFSVLFFETILGTTKDEEGVNVLVAGRIGALYFIHAKGSVNRDGKIKSVDIRAPQGNKPMEIVTTFENTGNVDVALGGNFLIMDASGKVQARGDLNKIYTFPGSTANGATQWIGRLPKGSYQALLTYDLGKGKSLVEEKALSVD